MKYNLFSLWRNMTFLFLFTSVSVFSQTDPVLTKTVRSKLEKWKNPLTEWSHIGRIRLDSVKQPGEGKILKLFYSPSLSYYPLREENIELFRQSVKTSLGRKFKKFDIEIYSNGYDINRLVPNIYRTRTEPDAARIQPSGQKPVLLRDLSVPAPAEGLAGRSIALWHSHGYYFEMNLDRWEWQRARLFGTVEDISVMGYVLPYLSQMLERAGANVFLPRERDPQANEVIVDNDRSTGTSEVVLHPEMKYEKAVTGFRLTDTLFNSTNPFHTGTSIRFRNDSVTFVPDIPEEGDYYVSISYPNLPGNSEGVRYSVIHTGGRSEYLVNQTIGGNTWIYLGRYHFRKGKNAEVGSVVVGQGLADNGFIAVDAVRFGGGMGSVARRPSQDIIANQRSVNELAPPDRLNDQAAPSQFSWKLSGKPRFVEGSRYWLQYAGMPDTLVYSPNTYKNDYNDDYQSRGLWVNYLKSPVNPGQGVQAGLGIPLDLSIAFHTDAGVTPNDSIIGTLAIYSTGADNGIFPDGTSRLASRDLSDIIQTQIVSDLRIQYNPEWTRRGIWDRPYAEARRPNVPALLLELLSHQNQADQVFGLDPRFRFAVSRAIYKGIVKYLSYNDKRQLVIQPLAVNNLAITHLGGKKIKLTWEPVTDPLEPSAKPERYRVRRRIAEGGFDNGIIVDVPFVEIELDSYNTVYGFKVTAMNRGGESSDSEVLSAGFTPDDSSPVVIVNCFDRISGPEWFDTGKMAGVAWWKDRGVADRYEISAVGDQYDFDRKSAWLDDDNPGWGASYADREGLVIPGNTFDFTMIHGAAIMAAGRSFYSVSDEYFESEKFNGTGVSTLDILLGEERAVSSYIDPAKKDFMIYTPAFMKRMESLISGGSNVFISGAYIGSDLYSVKDSSAIKFAMKNFHFTHRTSNAVNDGKVASTDYALPDFRLKTLFNTAYSKSVYQVESPGAIEASGKGAKTILRYTQNNTSAGIAYRGTNRIVAIGFPFETIKDEKDRNLFMKQVINFLGNKPGN